MAGDLHSTPVRKRAEWFVLGDSLVGLLARVGYAGYVVGLITGVWFV